MHSNNRDRPSVLLPALDFTLEQPASFAPSNMHVFLSSSPLLYSHWTVICVCDLKSFFFPLFNFRAKQLAAFYPPYYGVDFCRVLQLMSSSWITMLLPTQTPAPELLRVLQLSQVCMFYCQSSVPDLPAHTSKQCRPPTARQMPQSALLGDPPGTQCDNMIRTEMKGSVGSIFKPNRLHSYGPPHPSLDLADVSDA